MERNRRTPATSKLLSLLTVAVMLSAGVARAEELKMPATVQSRIIVVLDTSYGMRQPPKGGMFYTDDDDWNGASTLSCESRFCIGKRELAAALDTYAEQAKIGLAGYYQYLLSETPKAGFQTRCVYDVLAKTGDFTESFQSADNSLDGKTIYPPAGVVNANCQDTAAEKYLMKKTGETTTTKTCVMSGFSNSNVPNPTPKASVTFTTPVVPGCESGFAYTPTADAPIKDTAKFQKLVYPTQSCGTGSYSFSGGVLSKTATLTNGPVTDATLEFTNTTTVGTNYTNWILTGASSAECATPATCRLFREQEGMPTPTTASSTIFWLGFVGDTSTAPAATVTGKRTGVVLNTATNWSARPSATPAASTYSWTALGEVGGNCPATSTVTSGSMNSMTDMSTFNYTTLRCVANGGAVNNVSDGNGFTNMTCSGGSVGVNNTTDYTARDATASSATGSSNLGDCTAGWPCDRVVSKVADVYAGVDTQYRYCASGAGCASAFATAYPAYAQSGPANDPAGPYYGAWAWTSPGTCPAMSNRTSDYGTSPVASCSVALPCDFSAGTVKSGSATKYCGAGGTTAANPSEKFYVTGGLASPDAACSSFQVQSSTGTYSWNAYGASPSCPTVGSTMPGPAGTKCPAGKTCEIFGMSAGGVTNENYAGTTTNTTPPSGYEAINGGTYTTNTTTSWVAPSGGCTKQAVTCGVKADCAGVGALMGDATLVYDCVGGKCSFDAAVAQLCKSTTTTYSWKRPVRTCTATFKEMRWVDVGAAATRYRCEYNRNRYTFTRDLYRPRCRFDIPVRPYKFENVQLLATCDYFRLKKNYEYSSTVYDYSYAAKGGEVFDKFTTATTEANYCGSCPGNTSGCETYSGGFGTGMPKFCPLELTGTVTDEGGGTHDCSTRKCKLRWRSTVGAETNGRNVNAKSATDDKHLCMAPDASWSASAVGVPTKKTAKANEGANASISACPPGEVINKITLAYYGDPADNGSCNDTTLPTSRNNDVRRQVGVLCLNKNSCSAPINNTSMGGDPAVGITKCARVEVECGPAITPDPNIYRCDFASGSGTRSFKLVNDYYESGTPNVLATTWPDTATIKYVWNNQPTKESGWSAKEESGALKGMPLFVPIPSDSESGKAALLQATSKCERPNASNVSTDGQSYTAKGLCTAENMSLMGIPGMTPLYGSIKNAGDYLAKLIDEDPERACRKYTMLLITDGDESTPAKGGLPGYDQAELEALAANVYASGVKLGRTEGIFVNVIGFGEDTTSPASMAHREAMAAAGKGTATNALEAGELAAQIAAFFVKATEGFYSRSRPAIASDGKRIYAAYFSKSGKSMEHQGNLLAYDIDPSTGVLSDRWDFAAKANEDPAPLRVVHTENGGVWGDFDASNPALMANLTAEKLDSKWPSSPTLTAAEILNFVLNPSKNAPFRSGEGSLRLSRVGAITHSSPVVVGNSRADATYGGKSGTAQAAYQSFQALSRPQRVYVGTSDGLRSIVESETTPAVSADGQEDWMFVPGEMQSQLWREMRVKHLLGVDAPSSVHDVCGAGYPADKTGSAENCSAGQWSTVLYGAMRGGGKSVFAIDIRDNVTPKLIWSFENYRLFETWSTPAVGRVKLGTKDYFAAIFGGGRRFSSSAPSDGHLFILNALSGKFFGTMVEPYHLDSYNCSRPSCLEEYKIDLDDSEITSRPALYRPPNSPYISAAVVGVNGEPNISTGMGKGLLAISRFGETNTTTWSWRPKVFFDPGSSAFSKDPTGKVVEVQTVGLDDPGTPVACSVDGDCEGGLCNAGFCKVWKLVKAKEVDTSVKKLPLKDEDLSPIYLRTKVSAIWDPSGNLADYFVGTGNALEPVDNPSGSNFFYAVHDSGTLGQPLWVFRFPHDKEQVLGEPAIVPGTIFVTAFEPPSVGTKCEQFGNSWIYAFDPKTGQLKNSILRDTGAGKSTSVMKCENCGMLSDLVAVGDTLYYMKENSKPEAGGKPVPSGQRIVVAGAPGKVQSWRRIK